MINPWACQKGLATWKYLKVLQSNHCLPKCFRSVHKIAKSYYRLLSRFSVCPSFLLSVRIEELASHSTDFHEIWYFSNFLKSVEKIKFSLQSDKTKEDRRWKSIDICGGVALNYSYNDKCFRKNLLRKSNTHILCPMTLKESLAFYEIFW